MKVMKVKTFSTSPLRPLKSFLKYGRFISGFPAYPVDEDCVEFKSSKWAYFVCAVSVIAQTTSVSVTNFIYACWADLSITDFMAEALINLGLKIGDGAAVIAMISISATINFTHLYLVRGAREFMTSFCRASIAVPGINIQDEEVDKLFKGSVIKMCIGTLLIASSTTMTQTLSYLMFKDVIPSYVGLSILVFNGLAWTMTCFSPFSFVLHVVLHQLLGAANLMLEKYAENLQEKRHGHIATGKALLNIMESLNKALEHVLLLEVSVCIIILVLASYFGSTFFAAFAGGTVKRAHVIFGLAQLLFGAFFYMRRGLFLLDGQKLCDSYAKIRDRLQDIQIYEANDDVILSVLIDRFSRPPIRPWDLYDLRFSSGLSMDGLIVTYVIVLLQFKFA